MIDNLQVGQDKAFKSITDAVNHWKNNGRKKTIINISAGEYNESVFVGGGSNISFIGDSKQDVIWRTKTGYYKDAPLHVQGGYIKNITFIADTTDNPNFQYIPLQNGNPFVDNIGSAYGLHSDFYSNAPLTVIEDCIIISHVNAGLGAGTKANQELQIRNCDIFSYTPIGFNSQAFDNGALVTKSDYGNGIKNQKLKMYNNKIYSENSKAMLFLNQSRDAECQFLVEFKQNSLETKNGTNLLTFSSAFGLEMSKASFGNNAARLNYAQ